MTTDDSAKTQAELIGELVWLRRRVADLEKAGAGETARPGGAAPPDFGHPGQQQTISWYRVDGDAAEITSLKAASPGSAKGGFLPGGQQELLREILAGAPGIVWAVDGDGACVLIEGEKVKSLGRAPGEPVSRSMVEIFADVPQILENTRRAMAGESFYSTIQIDGDFLASWQSPLRSPAGEIVGVVGLALDVSEHRRLEEEWLAKQRLTEEALPWHQQDHRLIAYEIHDGLVQDATGAQMQLEALLQTEQVPPGPAREQIELALELVRRAVGEGRRLISGLRPPTLDESGVVAAIESLIDDQPADGPSIKFVVDVQFERLEPFLERAVYRIAQEAITNVRRHSKSDRAEVRLSQVRDRIRIEVRDWGAGFDPAGTEGKRLGLQGIRERARLLRGRVSIDSAPGEGTRVFVDLPLAYAP